MNHARRNTYTDPGANDSALKSALTALLWLVVGIALTAVGTGGPQ